MRSVAENTETMLEPLTRELENYHSKYRHPSLPRLEPGELYALFPEDDTELLAKSHWPKTWPNNGRSGVYLVYSKAGDLLYVGKARFLGGRLSSHFQYDKSGDGKGCKLAADWGEPRPMFVVTVAVPDGFRAEAAALEEFLIERLNPALNKRGRPELERLQ